MFCYADGGMQNCTTYTTACRNAAYLSRTQRQQTGHTSNGMKFCSMILEGA